jgi:hypothetical protein
MPHPRGLIKSFTAAHPKNGTESLSGSRSPDRHKNPVNEATRKLPEQKSACDGENAQKNPQIADIVYVT